MAPQKEVRIKDISFPVVRNALNAGLLSFQCLMWWTHETAVILDEQVIKTLSFISLEVVSLILCLVGLTFRSFQLHDIVAY